MNRLAIIPARSGSKRIPKKNIKDFFGKPVIAYSIEAAINSKLFDEVMVSTDDPEIAAIAIQYGATVPFLRSESNSNDFATTLDVLKEVEMSYKQIFKKSFDYICCIYATAPLINKDKLIEGYHLMVDKGFDSVFPVVEFSYPVKRGVEIVDGKTRMVWPEYKNSRSQDLETVYHDAGQWYWYNPNKIENSLFKENTASVILSPQEVQDIDTHSDWLLAELKFKLCSAP